MLERIVFWIKGIMMPERGCSGCCIHCRYFEVCKTEMIAMYGETTIILDKKET
ncbi:MAG: hypothetical protein K6E64_07045 [Lachnospiraceae bacterium]|nr:hypothetical protein [Lachnospiraceae bacterium]